MSFPKPSENGSEVNLARGSSSHTAVLGVFLGKILVNFQHSERYGQSAVCNQ